MTEKNKSLTILVADDSPFSRSRVIEILEKAGYGTITAGDGLEVLEKIDQEKPDCILLDLLMPKMSGIDVLKELHEKKNIIPVIVLSGDVQKTTQVECKNLGAFDFVEKPIRAELVLSAVKTALS